MRAWRKTETEGTEREEHHKEESAGLAADSIGKVGIRWGKGEARQQWLGAQAHNDGNRSEQLQGVGWGVLVSYF